MFGIISSIFDTWLTTLNKNKRYLSFTESDEPFNLFILIVSKMQDCTYFYIYIGKP